MADPAGRALDYTVELTYRGNLALNQFLGTLPHSIFIKDEVLWCSYYVESVAKWEISDPRKVTLMDHLDTSKLTSGFGGVYPFTLSGYAYVNDRENGLIIVNQ